MALFGKWNKRLIQKKANSFVNNLSKLSDKEIQDEYLNNKDLADNEIVLSYIFFNHPDLIKILPVDFQKSRINSNVRLFNYGSSEAKKEIVSEWLKLNKLFMNFAAINLSEEEEKQYIGLYFNQREDVVKLYMEDLKKVITVLAEINLKETELLLDELKENFTDKQWEFIIQVNPSFIKYASQNIQNKYADDDKYSSNINGEAKEKLIASEVEKIKNNFEEFNKSSFEIKLNFIEKYPFKINYIDNDSLIEILKYNNDLISYLNLSSLKKEDDKSNEIILKLIENSTEKTSDEIKKLFLNKCLFNAKGKSYRFDKNSNNMSYQYTKRILKIFQSISSSSIIDLIKIDSNYVIPYVLPIYNENSDISIKENSIIESNSKCLNLFKIYYGDEIYNDYYKVINKIYKEYLNNYTKYDYQHDYNCLFDLLKILFNKNIMESNPKEKIQLFIGSSIMYKDNIAKFNKQIQSLLNTLIDNAYGIKTDNNKNLFNIFSLELFDKRLSFINKDLLNEYNSYNYTNVSSLLNIIKNDEDLVLYKYYYNIMIKIYNEDKETLYRTCENYFDFKDILKESINKELTIQEQTSLIELLSSYDNSLHIKTLSDLDTYEMNLLKKLSENLSCSKDINEYRNLLSNNLLNIGYDSKGNTGWLDIINVKEICDVYNFDKIDVIEINNQKIFTPTEKKFLQMIKDLFSTDSIDVLFNYFNKLIELRAKRNIISIIDTLKKLKKYRYEIINNQIVTLNDIENYCITIPNKISKEIQNGITIYNINNIDFKVLCSLQDDGIHYSCIDISKLKNNSYIYDRLDNNGSFRFSIVNNQTIIKLNKDRVSNVNMKVTAIIIVGDITSEILAIASSIKLPIVHIKGSEISE